MAIKSKLYRTFLKILFLTFLISTNAQISSHIDTDSLQYMTYDKLNEEYFKNWQDTLASKEYLKVYLAKSISEENIIRNAEALTLLSYYEKESSKIKMLDEAIELTKNLKSTNYPILPYSFKAGYYADIGQYNLAIDNYLKILHYAEQHNNETYIKISKHNIGLLKGDLGKFEQALELIKGNYEYEANTKIKYIEDYNQSLVDISQAYLRVKKYDSAYVYISEGLKNTKDTSQFFNLQFVLQEAIYLQNKGDFLKAQKKLDYVDQFIDKKNSENYKTNLVLYSYLGKNQLLLNQPDVANKYFNKLDSLFSKKRIALPEVRFGYEHLVKFYKNRDNKNLELKYINSLLTYDSIFHQNADIIGSRLFYEFDTPVLLREKEVILKELSKKTNNQGRYLIALIIIICATIFISYYQFTRRRSYKNKLDILISEESNKPSSISTKKSIDSNKILSPEIIDRILVSLDNFESDKGYIVRNLSRQSLAKKLNTNAKYLSYVLREVKKNSFSDYINILRIDFAISKIKQEKKIRNYTIQGIAEEVGFNNAQSFSSAFRKHTGVKPSDFIKKLNNP